MIIFDQKERELLCRGSNRNSKTKDKYSSGLSCAQPTGGAPMSGKGSTQRPRSVSDREYANRWDAIFGKDLRVVEEQQNEDEAFEQIAQHNERERKIQPGELIGE